MKIFNFFDNFSQSIFDYQYEITGVDFLSFNKEGDETLESIEIEGEKRNQSSVKKVDIIIEESDEDESNLGERSSKLKRGRENPIRSLRRNSREKATIEQSNGLGSVYKNIRNNLKRRNSRRNSESRREKKEEVLLTTNYSSPVPVKSTSPRKRYHSRGLNKSRNREKLSSDKEELSNKIEGSPQITFSDLHRDTGKQPSRSSSNSNSEHKVSVYEEIEQSISSFSKESSTDKTLGVSDFKVREKKVEKKVGVKR